jgi:tetratricopeptide (TPR) repeat protein
MLRGPEQIAWLDRLEVERDNLRAALGWVSQHGGVDAVLRLVVALGPYWEARGYLSEGRRWLDAAVAASRADGTSHAIRLPSLLAAGRLAHWQVDLTGAEALLTEALATARDLADRRVEGEALGWLASVHWQQGAYEQGRMLGEESLRLGHEVADEFVIGWALLVVGLVLRTTGKPDQALTVLDECVLRFRRLGDLRYAAITSTMLGWASLEAGEHDRAALIFYECARTLRMVGDQRFIVYALRGLSHVANARGEPRRAVARFGASESLRTELGMRLPPRNHAGDQKLIASLRQQLATSEYDEVYAEVEAMSLDQVLAEISESP